jgi:hypothetical protein
LTIYIRGPDKNPQKGIKKGYMEGGIRNVEKGLKAESRIQRIEGESEGGKRKSVAYRNHSNCKKK